MRLTQQTNYAVRTLIYCAANPDKPSRVADIAASFEMSETHLFKILKVLVSNGFVRTLRGRNGGLMLARPAEEITCGFGTRTAPVGVQVYNPAFDITPARLVSAIVTEAGLIREPDQVKVEAVLRAAGASLTGS